MTTAKTNALRSANIFYFVIILFISFLLVAMPSRGLAIDVSDSFESNIDKKEYVYHGDNATFFQTNDASEAHTGKRSLKIISNNSGARTNSVSELTRWMTGITQYPVTAGERLTTSVYMKSQNVSERGVLAVSYFKDKGSGTWADAWVSTATSQSQVSGSSDWKKLSLSMDIPQDAKYARFEFRLFDKGTLWVDDFTIRDTGQQIEVPRGGNSNIKVYETPDRRGDQWGAQVVLGEKHFIWVNASCKAKLISDGNKVSVSSWKDLNSKYENLKTNALDCSEVRAFESYEEVKPDIDEPEPGPSEVITKTPGAEVNDEAILYTGPNQFDTSVIPEDSVVSTTLHGRFNGRGQQLFTVDCLHSHYKSDDPIVYPGQSNASHNHEFFGDSTLGAHSSIESIIGNKANTCEVGGDRSAYWTPTAYQDGKEVKADNNKFYYKIGNVKPEDIVPMPTGLRMIAGNANATGPQSPQVTYLFATPSEGKHTEPHTQDTKGGRMFTINERENGVRLQVQFPQCWDGKHLWLPNSKHMAYPKNGKCPSTHPKAFFQLMFNLGYSDATGGEGFRFSSGPWYTAHADFVNGWRPETLEKLVETCVRGQRYCGLTKSDSQPCASRKSLSRIGCIEFRAGEDEPRFFGKTF